MLYTNEAVLDVLEVVIRLSEQSSSASTPPKLQTERTCIRPSTTSSNNLFLATEDDGQIQLQSIGFAPTPYLATEHLSSNGLGVDLTYESGEILTITPYSASQPSKSFTYTGRQAPVTNNNEANGASTITSSTGQESSSPISSATTDSQTSEGALPARGVRLST